MYWEYKIKVVFIRQAIRHIVISHIFFIHHIINSQLDKNCEYTDIILILYLYFYDFEISKFPKHKLLICPFILIIKYLPRMCIRLLHIFTMRF